jgi:tetratricopeptide (TPR) repeat protein
MTSGGERRIHPAVIAALLALVTIAVFLPALRCGFVSWDDPRFHPGLSIVREGLSWHTVEWALGETNFFSHWIPLTVISHLLDFELWDDRPAGHHLTSLLLHAATVVLLFAFWRAATRRDAEAAAAALLWGVHPLRVESVVWLGERKDVLSGCLAAATLLLYVQWVHQPSRRRYVAMAATFVLALLSKQIVMTLPVLLLLLDRWPLRRLESAGWQLVREKVPFFALGAAGGVLAWWTQRQGGAMLELAAYPLRTRLANALVSLRDFLAVTFWPARISAYYPLHPERLRAPVVAGAALFLVAVTALCLATRRRWPWLAMGWLWFLAAILPVAGITQVGEQARYDRYTYLPHIGLCMAVVWSAARLLSPLAPRARSAVAVTGLAMVALACAADTRAQIAHWRDSVALFGHMVALDESNDVGHLYLGRELLAQHRLPEALVHLRRAVALRPDNPRAQTNLGVALAAAGESQEAAAAFSRALQLDPTLTLPRRNLAFLAAQHGDREFAIRELTRVVALDPGDQTAARALAALRALPATPGPAPTAAPRAPYPP